MAQNYTSFRYLLKLAIGTYSQAQFAAASHISAEHLNRMINKEVINKPSDATLHKIAANAKNGITYQMLVNAIKTESGEKQETEPEDVIAAQYNALWHTDFEHTAGQVMATIAKIAEKRTENETFDTLDNTISSIMAEAIEEYLPCQEICYRINFEGKYPVHIESMPNRFADFWCDVELTMSNGYKNAVSHMVLFYTELERPDGSVAKLVQKTSCSVKDYFNVCGIPPCLSEECEKDMDTVMDRPYFIQFNEAERFFEPFRDITGKNAEERVLNSIFGVKTEYTETTEGIGFYIEEANSEKIYSMLLSHKEMILNEWQDLEEEEPLSERMKQAASLQEIQNLLDEVEYVDGNCKNDTGWPATIALIMEKETGFPFRYRSASGANEKFTDLSEKSCILISETDRKSKNISRDAVLNAICIYAEALGIKTFGDILFTKIRTTFRKPKTYRVARTETEEKTKKERNNCSYPARIRDGCSPDRNGIYECLLVDGRQMRMIYIKEKNAYVAKHKEWTGWIEAFNPNPVKLPEEETA